MGKLMIVVGAVVLVLGGALLAVGRFTGIGHLPGDIVLEQDNVTVYFPIVTMILLSVILTVILNVVLRLFNR